MKNIILYVDDEPSNLFLFKDMMSENYDVITALSGHEGLKILEQQQNVEVVISDMRMPEMDGIDFIREASVSKPDLVYFILTGNSFNEHLDRAQEVGVIANFFNKPFDTEILHEAISIRLE